MQSGLSTVILGLVLVIWSTSAPAQSVYKWTDPQGVTHYTDQPPVMEKGATRLQLKVGAPEVGPTPPSAASSSSDTALANAEAAARVRNCERSKANVATLSSGTMLVDSTDPSAARRLDATQVAEARRAAEADVASYCGTPEK